MKIKINYDLMEKIKQSKNGIELHRIIKNKVITFGVTLTVLTPLYVTSSLRSTIISILSSAFYCTVYGGIDYLVAKKFKDSKELRANLELSILANELSNLEVRTNAYLLKDAEVIKTNYKINFRDNDKLPILKEEKYIDVPLCNGYKETLLQEHNIGSKEYEISVKEPTKKMSFKLSKATN